MYSEIRCATSISDAFIRNHIYDLLTGLNELTTNLFLSVFCFCSCPNYWWEACVKKIFFFQRFFDVFTDNVQTFDFGDMSVFHVIHVVIKYLKQDGYLKESSFGEDLQNKVSVNLMKIYSSIYRENLFHLLGGVTQTRGGVITMTFQTTSGNHCHYR